VGVAQLVELRIVIPAVVGSSPIVHPNIQGYPARLSCKVILKGLSRKDPNRESGGSRYLDWWIMRGPESWVTIMRKWRNW
jgi:hypothetical protein